MSRTRLVYGFNLNDLCGMESPDIHMALRDAGIEDVEDPLSEDDSALDEVTRLMRVARGANAQRASLLIQAAETDPMESDTFLGFSTGWGGSISATELAAHLSSPDALEAKAAFDAWWGSHEQALGARKALGVSPGARADFLLIVSPEHGW